MPDPLDQVFHALADPTRRSLLQRLRSGPVALSVLAAPLPMSLPAASKHVRVLEEAGLVSRSRSGRSWIVQLAPEPLGNAAAWIEHYRRFWTAGLDRLDVVLAELAEEESP